MRRLSPQQPSASADAGIEYPCHVDVNGDELELAEAALNADHRLAGKLGREGLEVVVIQLMLVNLLQLAVELGLLVRPHDERA